MAFREQENDSRTSGEDNDSIQYTEKTLDMPQILNIMMSELIKHSRILALYFLKKLKAIVCAEKQDLSSFSLLSHKQKKTSCDHVKYAAFLGALFI